MTRRTTKTPHSLVCAAALTAVLAVPVGALAQDIALKSEDGTINLEGELIGFDKNIYTIKSKFGPISIDADKVDCFGDGCPSLHPAEPTATTWNVSLWGKRRAFTEHVEKLSELVSEKTDGQFTLEISYGGLSDSRENLDGIAAGAFEMAQFCAGYHAHKNRAITVLELPFLGVNSLEQEIELSQAIYEHPATVAEMAAWNATLLMPSPLPQYNLMGTGSPPMSLSDFKGMPVRATGGIGNALSALGALLVPIPATEVEEFMVAGVVKAVSFAPHAHMAFDTVDSGVWWTTNLNPGTVNCPVVVNAEALEALHPVHRDALMSSVDDALDHYVSHYNGATMDAWGPALNDRGIVQLSINDQILKNIHEAVAAPAAESWIAKNANQGLPAQDLYDLVIATLTQGS